MENIEDIIETTTDLAYLLDKYAKFFRPFCEKLYDTFDYSIIESKFSTNNLTQDYSICKTENNNLLLITSNPTDGYIRKIFIEIDDNNRIVKCNELFEMYNFFKI